MLKKIPIFLLAMTMLFTSAYATDIAAPGTGSSTAKVSQTASVINVTVPTSLPVTVNINNEITVSDTAKIINNSFGPIKVSNIQLNTLNSWTLVDYATNFKASKVGLKQFGFQLKGSTVPNTGIANLDGFTVINGGFELPITYSAKTAVQRSAITEDLGSIVFTISWDKAVAVYGIVPANVTDYYTFTDDTATTGGWKLGLNADFKTSLQANSTYMDWTPGSPLPNPGNMYQGTPVTSIKSTFNNCTSIISLDLGSWDTSNVKSFGGMFQLCSALTYLNLSSFNTSNATTFSMMFNGCSSLTNIDISGFDTSNATSISYMFQNCIKLNSLYISNFNTSKVTTMRGMFFGCSGLVNVDVSSFTSTGFTPTGTNYTSYMFSGCTSLKSIDLSAFDTYNINVSLAADMFVGCTSVTTAYAHNQTDADLFNANTNKSPNVNFVVKP